MMTLTQAARFFDINEFTDHYNPSVSFYGQLLAFADSVRSGISTRRRILDVAASVEIPEKRTITSLSGVKYLVAEGSEDLYRGEVIRMKYPIAPVQTQFQIRTVGQLLANSGGVTDAFVLPFYARRNRLDEQADYLGAYEMYYSSYYMISTGSILYGGGRYYRVMEMGKIDDVGFGVVNAVELETPISTMTFYRNSAYDPVENTRTVTQITGVAALTERITLDYQHEALGYIPLEHGDKAISFLKSVVNAVVVGEKIGTYKILSVDSHTDFWTVHGRPPA